MARRANGLLVAVVLVACNGAPSQANPTKLSEERALVDPPARPEKTGRFEDPNVDPPGPRTPQVTPEALDAALAEAKRLVGAGTPAKAVAPLQRCANKTPASARCDGELGIILAELGTQKAHMRHLLAEAAKTNDAAADADLYRRIAAAARRRGQHPARADAMATLIARGEATAADYYEQGQALSADATRVADAIEALRVAHDKDSTKHDWLLERGVLEAQANRVEEAVATLQAYLEAAPADAPRRAAAQQRLAQLNAERSPAADGG